MKTARAIDWSETTGTESALAERCAAGDAQSCQELVDEHQRMVYHLAFQLLHSLLNLQQRHDEELHRLRRLLPICVGNRMPGNCSTGLLG